MLHSVRAASLAVFALALAGTALAADYENPPVFSAAALLGPDAQGQARGIPFQPQRPAGVVVFGRCLCSRLLRVQA